MKTHRAAVAIVPPDEVWEPIEVIRRRHDPKIERWCPHLNLLYPFRKDADLERLRAACRELSPFTVAFRRASSFEHHGGRHTVWLEPEPREKVRELQSWLQAAFPECDDVSRHHAGFTPHLSVGQAHGRDARDALVCWIEETFPGITFEVGSVAVMHREEATPFRVVERIPLRAPG